MRKIMAVGAFASLLASCAHPGVSAKVDAVVLTLTTADNAYVKTCRDVPTLGICIEPRKTQIKALAQKAYDAVKAAEQNEALISFAIDTVNEFSAATKAN